MGRIMILRSMLWMVFFLVTPIVILQGWCQSANEKPIEGQVTRPVHDAVKIRQAIQKEEEKWRGEQERLLARYEQLQGEHTRLQATHDELQENIRSTRQRISRKEKELADIEQISSRIEPFLGESVETLRRQLTEDLPFLPEERHRRVDRLAEMLTDPDVAVSEKYRKIMEAWLVEAEYGNTIEVYQQTIAIEGKEVLVNIFRLGRISLFFQTLDRDRCGFFDVSAKAWQMLPVAYNRAIGTAIEIGTKRRPAELLSLPLGRITVK